ncbi:DinB family protein [Flectobacillus major]|uniref:DinB family protein n=1 Tax=Flectobacillus major TaxID=103 RepID=UPI0003F89125|nr:DinB family protein [Flectobacillus major]
MDFIQFIQKGLSNNNAKVAKIYQDVSPEELFFRPYSKVNHLAWELGHIAFVRNTLIKLLNPDEKLSLFSNEKVIFAPKTPLQPNEVFPPLEELLNAFSQRGEQLLVLLSQASPQHLASVSPFNLPFVGVTVEEQLSTFFLHEYQHLGEIGYLKNIITRLRFE